MMQGPVPGRKTFEAGGADIRDQKFIVRVTP